MQLFVEIQGVADLLQGDESFTSAAEVWLVADTLKRTGPRSGSSEQAQFTPSALEDQTIAEVKFAEGRRRPRMRKRLAHFS